jgi:hypothetical protein
MKCFATQTFTNPNNNTLKARMLLFNIIMFEPRILLLFFNLSTGCMSAHKNLNKYLPVYTSDDAAPSASCFANVSTHSCASIQFNWLPVFYPNQGENCCAIGGAPHMNLQVGGLSKQ